MPSSERIFQAQDGDRLVVVLDDLETLLAEERKPVLESVLGTHAHIGTATVHVATMFNIEVGVGEAQQGVDGEGRARRDHVVEVDVGVDGTHAVILEVVHELGSDAEAVHGFYLQLEAQACHGVLGRVGELCARSNVALFGAGAEGSNDGQNGQKDEFFHLFN